MDGQILNQVATQRLRRGWTQADLAMRLGVSRQTIVAIESGKSAPHATLLLRLAATLQCDVAALFWLDDRLDGVRLAGPAAPGTRLVVAEVDGSWVAHPLDDGGEAAWRQVADAVVEGDTLPQVRAWRPPEVLRHNLLISGCDPALGLLAAHANDGPRRGRAIHVEAPSGQSLRWLAERAIHVAGFHSGDHGRSAASHAALSAALPRTPIAVFELARWPLGLVVARGNPKSLRHVVDLAQPSVRLVNRDHRAAARQLLDHLLAEARVPTEAVMGYDQHARSHLAVAQAVAWGLADAGVATAHAAAAWGLAFIPLAEDCFELALPADGCGEPRVAALLETARSHAFRREAGRLAGYDTSRSGEIRATVGG